MYTYTYVHTQYPFHYKIFIYGREGVPFLSSLSRKISSLTLVFMISTHTNITRDYERHTKIYLTPYTRNIRLLYYIMCVCVCLCVIYNKINPILRCTFNYFSSLHLFLLYIRKKKKKNKQPISRTHIFL